MNRLHSELLAELFWNTAQEFDGIFEVTIQTLPYPEQGSFLDHRYSVPGVKITENFKY